MDGPAVNALREGLARPLEFGELIALPHAWHLKDKQSALEPGPAAAALALYSLSAVTDYLEANRDELELKRIVVHVVSPHLVRVIGPLRERRDRETFVEAKATDYTDNFLGRFLALEEFIIGLQSRFMDLGVRTDVLKLIASVKHEKVQTSADDGVTQTVTAKAGIALVAEAAVPNPVRLMPFRTFREIAQPESEFVLRLQGGEGRPVTAGLFEADGGTWRNHAMDHIATWLKARVPDGVAVLA